jgi:APA family basic amino acid/polyamine antiporter
MTPAARAEIGTDAGLIRAIGLTSATLFVVGAVIGSGIFLTTGLMLVQIPSASLLLLAWMAGGVVALAGGLTYGEMGTMFPRSGGMYVFLREAYGPLYGFLFGWAALLVTVSGGVAAVAVGFADYLGYLVPPLAANRITVSTATAIGSLDVTAGQFTAVAAIAILGTINYVGVRSGNLTSAVLTAAKVAGLAVLPVLAWLYGTADPSFAPVVPAGIERPAAAFGVAMIAVFWAYDAWYFLTFAAGEVQDPQRTLPRALIAGILVIATVYITVNVAYLFAVPIDEMKGVVRIGEFAASRMAGPAGGTFIAATVVVSTFGCNAAAILAGSRLLFAVARDGLFLRSVSVVHPRFHTPHIAIVATSIWAAVLAWTGTYEQLFTYVVFGSMLFHVACGIAVFRLRRIRPEVPRPYRVWGYPIVPFIFVLGSLAMVANTLVERPQESIVGLGFIALGVPVYWYWKKKT